jgi:putative ABC transport system permease protein
MLNAKYLPLVFKYVVRYRARSALTILGIALGMFMFYSVQAMENGVREATTATAEDATLVVYREDRFCPFTSRLPEDYQRKIADVDGVKAVVPMKIVVSNCRASLDVVTFRGVPDDAFDSGMFAGARIIEGSAADWKRRSDAALVGKLLADRRGWSVGDRVAVDDIQVTVAGIIDSDQPQDRNVAYTDLEFIQRTAGSSDGEVTQFNVLVEDPQRLQEVAAAIDATFKDAQEPTRTWTEKEFVARAVDDVIEIVNFASWLGWGSLAAVFGLIANAIILSVRDRVRDHAVMSTLGFSNGLIGQLIVAESFMLSIIGGAMGLAAGMAVIYYGRFSFSVEGLSVNFGAGPATIFIGMGVCALIGVLAGLVPAWQASRRETVESFRAV